jgi:hypothetical protein
VNLARAHDTAFGSVDYARPCPRHNGSTSRRFIGAGRK